MREYMKGFGIPQLPSLQQASKLAPASSAFKQAKPTQKLTPQKNSSDLLSPPAFALLARFLEAVFGQQIQEIFGFGKRSPAKTVPRIIELGHHPRPRCREIAVQLRQEDQYTTNPPKCS